MKIMNFINLEFEKMYAAKYRKTVVQLFRV